MTLEEILPQLEPPDNFDARPAVKSLLDMALRERASDLHLRPCADGVEVLTRLDGVLQSRFVLPTACYPRLLVGLKNAARIASYKNAVPQDGRLTHNDAEMRVATVPTHFGEKVVVRLVTQVRGELPELTKLGYQPEELQVLEQMLTEPQGLVLATGPAGSGKTTTLLASLRWLVARHHERYGAALNVVTLEDPVECVLPEITQTAIAPGLGMSFASGLRSLLRQDPEVILVGEIRDEETAAAVIQCSLTGHLVFSTLHTRDSVGVVPRLLELSVQPYQLAASLAGVVYQRLVRKLCEHCKQAQEPEKGLMQLLKSSGPVYVAKGCTQCNHTGYWGRTAVPELLRPDDEFRQLVLDRAPLPELKEKAERLGTVALRDAALGRVGEGLTSYLEICRVIPGAVT